MKYKPWVWVSVIVKSKYTFLLFILILCFMIAKSGPRLNVYIL